MAAACPNPLEPAEDDALASGDHAGSGAGAVDLLGAVGLLREAASELDAVLERRADELAERLSEGDFRVAVCGGFSNGKSSLINALIGEDLLPVGVLPVTSIATEVRHGATAALIELDDGTRRSVAVTELAAWVSEANNPDNAKGVARVLVETPAPLLEPGVTLVDTPGLESIFEHNDTTAMATIRDAEGALVVLSADAPLTAAERRLLDVVAERASATFFSLNRADHLSTAEIDQAVSFVSDAVEAATGSDHQVFATSARRAIEARSSSDQAARDAGTDALHQALTNFVDRELVAVRQQAFALAVRRLADELADADALTTAIAGLAADELADRIGRFERAAETERIRLGEDTVLLAASVKGIAADLADWLARQGVASAEFAGRVQARADAIRAIAEETFGARLAPFPIPAVADEPDRFWYLFFRPELPDAPLWRALRLLLPHGWLRRRLIAAAHRRLVEELDKHAGRARSTLSERLAGTHRRFVDELSGHVEALIADIGRATQATRRQSTSAEARAAADRQRQQRLSVALGAAYAATAHQQRTEARRQ
ncbi:MAG: dynamin family protein [Candidatus Microthrix parvicella]